MKRNSFLNEIACLFLVLLGFYARAQCTATSVPYYEDFQSITTNNQLPACWAANSPSVSCLTFTMPGKFAAFNNNPAGTNYFYSRGLQLVTGVTYSAALFYKNDLGSGNSNLSILYGTSQSTAGLTSIVSVSGPSVSTSYSLLSGLFTVPSNGVYFIAVSGTGSGTAAAQYLNWDDLSLTVPCGQGGPGTPPLIANANSYTICADNIVNIVASGADTYLWNTGSTVPNIVVTPTINPTIYTVWGANSISGCIGVVTLTIYVNPQPQMTVVVNPSVVCAGQSATINANTGVVGTYTWVPMSGNGTLVVAGPVNNTATVYPTTNQTYSVFFSSPIMCVAIAGFSLTTLSLLVISISANEQTVCEGQMLTLSCGGATSFTWNFSGGTSNNVTLSVNPLSNSTYTASGTGINGCVGTKTILIEVHNCAGLNNFGTDQKLKVFPNPNNGVLTFENLSNVTIIVSDISGREVEKKIINEEIVELDISNYSSGLYYFKIQYGEKYKVFKVLKE